MSMTSTFDVDAGPSRGVTTLGNDTDAIGLDTETEPHLDVDWIQPRDESLCVPENSDHGQSEMPAGKRRRHVVARRQPSWVDCLSNHAMVALHNMAIEAFDRALQSPLPPPGDIPPQGPCQTSPERSAFIVATNRGSGMNVLHASGNTAQAVSVTMDVLEMTDMLR